MTIAHGSHYLAQLGDKLMLVNMSVWESLDAFEAYVFESDLTHRKTIQTRSDLKVRGA